MCSVGYLTILIIQIHYYYWKLETLIIQILSSEWAVCLSCVGTVAPALSPHWHSLAVANEPLKLSLSLGDLPLVRKDSNIIGEVFWHCSFSTKPDRPAAEFQLHNFSELHPLLVFWTCVSHWRKSKRKVIAFQKKNLKEQLRLDT